MTIARERAEPQPNSTTRPRRVVYPTSDGKPMGETERHVNVILDCIQGLRFHLRDRPDAYVVGNNFVFWEEGNPRARVSPDCYVVFGVDKRVRDSFMAWQENGELPDVVFEITSRSTRNEDTGKKFLLYEQVWRTAEYFQFDPKGDYLRPRLQGYRLGPDGRYVRLETVNDRLHSEQLGLDLVAEGDTLRFYDPAKDRFLPTLSESEEQRAEAEAERAEAEAHRAQAEAHRAQAEAERAQAEARSAVAEQENQRLRAELEALRRQLAGGSDAS